MLPIVLGGPMLLLLAFSPGIKSSVRIVNGVLGFAMIGFVIWIWWSR
jgi:hypothetical protein